MRGMLVRLGIGALALAAGGCSPGAGYTGASAYPPSPSGTFLATGSCAARVGTTYRQVACDDPTAWARVTTRRLSGDAAAPDCPATTDFVLTVDGSGAASQPSAPTTPSVPSTAVRSAGNGGGYACLRGLKGPHPGDPGGGGGPYTVVGDCVYRAGPGEAKETPCAGPAARVPRFTVTAVVADRSGCPAATSLYVGLPHGEVGCAGRP